MRKIYGPIKGSLRIRTNEEMDLLIKHGVQLVI
jgi:hypothetical protein